MAHCIGPPSDLQRSKERVKRLCIWVHSITSMILVVRLVIGDKVDKDVTASDMGVWLNGCR